jgi:hypothetical protein
MRSVRLLITAAATLTLSTSLFADCRNNFLNRTEGSRQIVTLLTGKLTFQEARQLAQDIGRKKKPPVEWIDGSGKVVARQFGELKVVRPMPVRCDEKPSGVIVVVTFPTAMQPDGQMVIRFDPELTVTFSEQG